MPKNLLVLPNQLYIELEEMKFEKIIFYEAAEYFTKYNYNQKKLLLHRASMKYFENRLAKKLKSTELKYFEYHNSFREILTPLKKLTIFDPLNKDLKKMIMDLASEKKIELEILESPNFLTTAAENKSYFEENKFFQHHYYKMQRKRLDILVDSKQQPEGGKWSFDQKNRKKFPKDIEIPELIQFNNSFLKEAKTYIKDNFAANPGNLENFFYPLTHSEAEKMLQDFIENRFENFGSYQDAFEKDIVVGFHSLISSSLNIGLLNPKSVVEKILAAYYEKKIPLASAEAFIRQIIGWREYLRAVYDLKFEELKSSNFFNHQRSFPEKFYQAESGIEPLDDSIKKAVNYSYTHHIERLMVLGNFFLLTELNSKEVFNWFMEMFIDGYEWVMAANIYAMSQYSYPDIMTKPYISASNYLKKMSHYQTGSWSEIWDALYWRFLDKHQQKFADNPRMALMLSLLKRMDQKKLEKHHKKAEKYLQNLNNKT